MHDVMSQEPAGFYDREADDDVRLGGRRAVADWGADELFHHAPRRRSRKAVAARERRVSGPLHNDLPRRFERRSGEPAVRPAQPLDAARPAVRPAAAHPETAVRLAAVAPPEEYVEERPATLDEVQGGRKTVQISGRPDPIARAGRRRPPRTVEERLGHRPDRVAGWAFALGMLLIVLAVLTA